MNNKLLEELRQAQQEIEPRFKALRGANSVLRRATKLAGEEPADALAMQKTLIKLEQTNDLLNDPTMQQATTAFASATQEALDALAFQFARDLKETFEQRGEQVEGRPPTLLVDILILQIDIASRKAQWFYGKEALTRPIPLSITKIIQAYDRQYKAIVRREIDTQEFARELYDVWQQLIAKRAQRPAGGRISLVEAYSQIVLNRQSNRFWNAPSRSTFKDYERAHFVRDLVLTHATPTVEIDGQEHHLRLGGATKSQADSASRSVWLPKEGLDGEYYAHITFTTDAEE